MQVQNSLSRIFCQPGYAYLLSYVSTVLEVCFDRARRVVRPCSKGRRGCFDRVRGVCRPCSRGVSTVLFLCFVSARPMFRLYSTYVSTVLDLFRLCSNYVSTVLELCFDCARHMFRQCSTDVSTVLDLRFDCARIMF